jgi:hypothetical protein
MRMILSTRTTRAAFERALGALEIACCGVGTAVAGFMLGLNQTVILISIYAVTVSTVYGLVLYVEHVQPLVHPGND